MFSRPVLHLQVERRGRIPWSLPVMPSSRGISTPWLPVAAEGPGASRTTATGASCHPRWTAGTTLWPLKAWRPWTASTRRTSSGRGTPWWTSRRTSTPTVLAVCPRAPPQLDDRYLNTVKNFDQDQIHLQIYCSAFIFTKWQNHLFQWTAIYKNKLEIFYCIIFIHHKNM